MNSAELECLQAQVDEFGESFAYRVTGADDPVTIRAIHRRGLIDGDEDTRHCRLMVMPGARSDANDIGHLPNNASANSGDTVTIDGQQCSVIDVVRRRGRFTRVTVQNP